MKTSGEAPGRVAAIDHETKPSPPVRDVLHILHGARSLPPAETIRALQPFLNTMLERSAGSDRLADASTAAVSALVQRPEAEGVATDDLWEQAIETCVSFANETSP